MSEQEKNPKYVPQQTLVGEIARDPQAADLLFSLFSSAINTMYQDPNLPIPKEKTLDEIVQTMPPMSELSHYKTDEELIQAIGSESAEILRSVILNSPIKYSLLPQELENPEFRRRSTEDGKKCYQFIVIESPNGKEEEFQAIKSKVGGSFFAFHGSVPECWHKINREELKDLTNTKFMRNGSAYGRGIALTLKSETGITYAVERPNKYSNSNLGKSLSITALCEVANLPDRNMISVDVDSVVDGNHQTKTLKGELRNNDWSFMLTLNEACIIRYLFVNLDADIDFNVQPLTNLLTLEQALHSKE